MPASSNNASPEGILRNLLEQARATWGDDRTRQIQETLETASRQLSQVANSLPDKETEPGFFQ
jgi:hypothetical protein